MYCYNCGKEVEDKFNVCPECHAVLVFDKKIFGLFSISQEKIGLLKYIKDNYSKKNLLEKGINKGFNYIYQLIYDVIFTKVTALILPFTLVFATTNTAVKVYRDVVNTVNKQQEIIVYDNGVNNVTEAVEIIAETKEEAIELVEEIKEEKQKEIEDVVMYEEPQYIEEVDFAFHTYIESLMDEDIDPCVVDGFDFDSAVFYNLAKNSGGASNCLFSTDYDNPLVMYICVPYNESLIGSADYSLGDNEEFNKDTIYPFAEIHFVEINGSYYVSEDIPTSVSYERAIGLKQ